MENFLRSGSHQGLEVGQLGTCTGCLADVLHGHSGVQLLAGHPDQVENIPRLLIGSQREMEQGMPGFNMLLTKENKQTHKPN